jgi:hypothetical protein
MLPVPLKPLFKKLGGNFISLVRLIDYRTSLGCVAVTVVLWPLIWIGFIRPTKPVMEIAAVVITGLFTLALLVRFALTRHLFILWALGFMAIALSREIHFTGSDEILLVGWPLLGVVALGRYDLFKSYLMNPVLINIVAAGFLFYFLSQTVDQRWWRVIPGEAKVSVRLEELIEVLGHCTVGAALLFSRQVRPPDKLASGLKQDSD